MIRRHLFLHSFLCFHELRALLGIHREGAACFLFDFLAVAVFFSQARMVLRKRQKWKKRSAHHVALTFLFGLRSGKLYFFPSMASSCSRRAFGRGHSTFFETMLIGNRVLRLRRWWYPLPTGYALNSNNSAHWIMLGHCCPSAVRWSSSSAHISQTLMAITSFNLGFFYIP